MDQHTDRPDPARPLTGTCAGVVVVGTGSELGADVADNHDVAAEARDWDDQRAGQDLHSWVVERIGVHRRHRVAPGQGAADLATAAVGRALADARLRPDDLDLLVLSTFTGDRRLPQVAAEVQVALGTPAKCLQLDAACAGFLDGLLVASALLGPTGARTAVVVHTEVMSAVCDPERFLLRAIFGDGAGAAVLRYDPSDPAGLGAVCTATSAHHGRAGWLQAGGGTLPPLTPEAVAAGQHHLWIDNAAIYPFAVDRMAQALLRVATASGIEPAELDWVIAHQTGVNISRAVAERTGIPPSRFLMTLADTGNTSGATIPIALDRARRSGRLRAGDRLALPTVGAGMAWGAVAATWADLPEPAGDDRHVTDPVVLDLRDPVPATGPGAVPTSPDPLGALTP